MKFPPFIAVAALFMSGVSWAQPMVDSELVSEDIPQEVVASAVQATAELCQAVVQGKYEVALERMNPKEKQRLAKQMGGMEAVEKKLAAVPAELVRQGVKIISSKPKGKPQSFGVEPKPTAETINGQQVRRMKYTQWLVLVPTVTRYKVLHRVEGQPPKWLTLESQSFQVAVSDRDKLDWTFLDGAGLAVGRLRNLYGTLPADIELPQVQQRQVPN